MNQINKFLTLIVLFVGLASFAQAPVIYGVILNENHQPVEGVSVYYEYGGTRITSISNATGFYKLDLQADKPVTVYFQHESFALSSIADVNLPKGATFEFNMMMLQGAEQIEGVVIDSGGGRRAVQGIIGISPETIRKIPGANPGVENIVKLLGGNSNNEMSTAYAVRGGNYDENLVYVEDFEIYRPFLIRSGQQEGLSFTNTTMVENVDFSAGGFQAKYGDKLSSVLDITYRRPVRYGAELEASFLGGSLTLEGISKDQRLSAIVGARYRDNSLLVNSQQTQTNFHPAFADVQTMINFDASPRWQHTFLGNISQNKYDYQPLTRQTNFGTLTDPRALVIYYEGQEKDKYTTYFGAYKATFKASDNFTLKLIGSVYHTQEQEHFDILAQYALGTVDTNIGSDSFGDCIDCAPAGGQLNHARNNLDALIVNTEVKGYHNFRKNLFEWGVKYTREDIRDRLVEYEVIDSAGFSVNPPREDLAENDQPYQPYTGPLVPYQNVRALNFAQINRFSGFVMWSRRVTWGESDVFLNAGVRAHQWMVNVDNGPDGGSQVTVSPRAQFAIKPKWTRDMLFRLSGGLYHQPPFYRELRDEKGMVQPNVKAQQSVHIVLGNDYSFKMWERPFKLVTEAYYKKLDDVNTYTIENVRIRYRANNDAVAYVYGADVRLNGQFVPGTESWVTVGYMKTEENINNRGYIARPTDQRMRVAVLFQDYVPNIPSLKMYLNLVYNTGLPGGSPSYADSYDYQTRLTSYKRADAGFSYVFADAKKQYPKGHWLSPFRELALGLEIFNLFDNQNSITNTWVRDAYSKRQYGIPNYLTSRVFSLKLNVRI